MKNDKWRVTIDVTEMIETHYTELGMGHIKEELTIALDGCHFVMDAIS